MPQSTTNHGKDALTISPCITEPVAQFVWHHVEGRLFPITLIVGNNWVTATDLNTYIVNADEPATYDQVKAMLIEAGGIGQWHSSK